MKIESLVFLFALRALICTRIWHSCCSPASIVHFGCLWYSAPFLTGFRVIHHLRESFYIACFGLDTLEKINFLLHTHRHTAHTHATHVYYAALDSFLLFCGYTKTFPSISLFSSFLLTLYYIYLYWAKLDLAPHTLYNMKFFIDCFVSNVKDNDVCYSNSQHQKMKR